MDPVTLKMSAQIVGSLLQSRTARRVVLAFVTVLAMLASLVAVTPALVAQSVLGARLGQPFTLLPSGSCLPGWDGSQPLPSVEGLSPEQVRLALILWQVAHREGMGDAGAVVGFVVLAQESTWGADPRITQPNGDGDAGPMQQRTLPGWYGTLAQVNDPEYAFTVFFNGRTVNAADVRAARAAGVRPAGPAGYHIPGLTNIAGWQSMPVTRAAQAVQRSAFPTAYARHERAARQLVSMFRAGAVSSGGTSALIDGGECGPSIVGECPATGLAVERGLLPDTLLLLRCAKQAWPQISTWYGVARRSGPSDHPRGGAIDIMIPNWRTPAGNQLGKRIADWVVANHERLGVKYVIWDASVWNAERQSGGWRACATTSCYSGPNDTQAHRDHVHVSVYGTRTVGTTPGGTR